MQILIHLDIEAIIMIKYLGYRCYNPRIHRFISTDNAIYDDVIGGNLYVYYYNNPVSKKMKMEDLDYLRLH